jgi:hypothetical protein
MNLIHNDIDRCDGRMVSLSIGTADPICPRRDQCARYRQMAIDRANAASAICNIRVTTSLCEGGDDYMIPMEAEES